MKLMIRVINSYLVQDIIRKQLLDELSEITNEELVLNK